MSIINPMATANLTNTLPVTLLIREEREQNLRPDQVIRAIVAEGGLEKVLLNLGSRQFWVETEVPLKAGQKLAFQVVENDGEIELHLVGRSLSDRLVQALHLLGEKPQWFGLLQELKADGNPLFAALTGPAQKAVQEASLNLIGQAETSDGKLLQSLAALLGIDFEARLAKERGDESLVNLKVVLLELSRLLEDSEGRWPEEIKHLKNWLDAMQLCQAKLNSEGLWLLPLPLPFLEYAYLVAERHTSGSEDQPEELFRLTLQLELGILGPLRIEVLWQEKSLFLRIYSSVAETREKFETGREELARVLEPFNFKGVTIADSPADPAGDLARLVTRSSKILDARI